MHVTTDFKVVNCITNKKLLFINLFLRLKCKQAKDHFDVDDRKNVNIIPFVQNNWIKHINFW